MERPDIYIVNENPILIQVLTRKHMKPVFSKFVIGCILFYMMVNWIPNIISIYFPTTIWDYLNITAKGIDRNSLPAYPMVMVMYAFAFEGVFQLGKALYVLTLVRNRTAEYGSIFEGFTVYGKALAISFLQTVICTLWTMCFIIPGVIARYGFRQSYFILADDPSKHPIQCMAESKLRMTGNKMNLFRLDISFLPYLMLGYLPQLIVGVFGVNAATLTGMAVYMLSDIFLVTAMAFWFAGCGVFYELLITGGFDNFRYANQEIFRKKGVLPVDFEE
ncbi:MAG: DUF975 family protein [Clostridiales bacterium]|nr:DUF975 family protein [Candidatus Crickella merdequi]